MLENNVIELPALLSHDSKELLRSAISHIAKSMAQLAQTERQIWTMLDHATSQRYGIRDHLLALQLSRGMLFTAKDETEDAQIVITTAIKCISNL